MSLDRMILTVERDLTQAATICPLLPGIAKISVGLGQSSIALLVGILAAIPSVCGWKAAQDVGTHAWSHIQHGLGNILRGLFESFFGTCCTCLNDNYPSVSDEVVPSFQTGQSDKVILYASLLKETGFLQSAHPDYSLFHNMSYQEAFSLGLINEEFVCLTRNAFHQVREAYNNDSIRIRGRFKSESQVRYPAFQLNPFDDDEAVKREADAKHQRGLAALLAGRSRVQ